MALKYYRNDNIGVYPEWMIRASGGKKYISSWCFSSIGQLTCNYAGYKLKTRWIEAEKYIKLNPAVAYQYSINIMHARWYEAEPYIRQNSLYWLLYCHYFEVENDK